MKELIEVLSWIAVELEGQKPDAQAVKKAIDKALILAAKHDITHQMAQHSVLRMAKVLGA